MCLVLATCPKVYLPVNQLPLAEGIIIWHKRGSYLMDFSTKRADFAKFHQKWIFELLLNELSNMIRKLSKKLIDPKVEYLKSSEDFVHFIKRWMTSIFTLKCLSWSIQHFPSKSTPIYVCRKTLVIKTQLLQLEREKIARYNPYHYQYSKRKRSIWHALRDNEEIIGVCGY